MKRIKCVRCGSLVDRTESRYVVKLLCPSPGQLDYEVVESLSVGPKTLIMHMNGDRWCVKEVPGFRSRILKELELPADQDTSFIDFI